MLKTGQRIAELSICKLCKTNARCGLPCFDSRVASFEIIELDDGWSGMAPWRRGGGVGLPPGFCDEHAMPVPDACSQAVRSQHRHDVFHRVSIESQGLN